MLFVCHPNFAEALFLVSLGVILISKRFNWWRQCLCKILEWQTKSIWYVKVFQEWSRIVVKISYSVSSYLLQEDWKVYGMTLKKRKHFWINGPFFFEGYKNKLGRYSVRNIFQSISTVWWKDWSMENHSVKHMNVIFKLARTWGFLERSVWWQENIVKEIAFTQVVEILFQ